MAECITHNPMRTWSSMLMSRSCDRLLIRQAGALYWASVSSNDARRRPARNPAWAADTPGGFDAYRSSSSPGCRLPDNAAIWSSAGRHELTIAQQPMTIALSSTRDRDAVLKLHGHTLDVEEFVECGRRCNASKAVKWWMRRTSRRRLLISMLPERAGRAC